MSNLYTPQAVREILNVTDACLCVWRRNGVGPVWFKRGGFIYYPVEKFKAYLSRVGPLPAGVNDYEKGRFFTEAHKTERLPGAVAESVTVAELAARLAVVERALAKLTAAMHKRRKRRKHLHAGERVLTAKVLRKMTEGVGPAE